MNTQQQIDLAHDLLATGLLTKVYHSCELVRDPQKGTVGPCYARGTEYVLVGVDDTQGMFAYIRSNGDDVGTPTRVQSCAHAYNLTVPVRVVVFADNELRDKNSLIDRLLSVTFKKGVYLQRVVEDKYRLGRDESDMYRAAFGPATFYVAIDVLLTSVLLPSQCEPEPCPLFPNPICPTP